MKILPVRYSGLLLAACALIAGWQVITSHPLSWRPGELVSEEPKQSDLDRAEPFDFEGVRVQPRAQFSAEVRVLGRERYWLSELAEVAPLDIAVGWGPMSDSAVLDQIDVSQSGRFYFWHYASEEPPIPTERIISHSANWHLVPASRAVWRTLSRIRVGSVVQLEGKLIDIETAEHRTIKTSLRRDDSGEGACEVIFVEQASLRYR